LEKVFDNVKHELLFELLRTYGIPEDMIDVIQRLFRNVTLKLNSGSMKDTILYSIGVKQGDAMAPVLFIVLMQAMEETLEEEWEAADINLLTYAILRILQSTEDACRGKPGTQKAPLQN
jgi:hypothetical protein